VSEPVPAPAWSNNSDGLLVTTARNLSTRYLVLIAELVIGMLMLPFNLAHLGPSQYGLWMLVGSITVHFSLLDMGYGGATVKFMAQYRAHRDARALNEIASTLFYIFAGVGLVAYAVAAVLAFNLDHLFKITPEQVETGKWLLLIVALFVAINFPFSVFGGITSGFQRYDINNVVSLTTTVLVAVVNVVILLAGGGLITLVATTTAVRISAYFIYRRNAYRVFPELQIRPSLFCRARLREVTGFSVWAAIINWAYKLNYQIDGLIVGAFLGSASVSVWAVAERIINGTQRLTNQFNGVLFPIIVDRDQRARLDQLQEIVLQGTRLSLMMVVPIAATLVLLAEPLVRAWVGPSMLGAVPVIQILAIVVAIRVGNASGTILLKGAGEIRHLALVNIATGIANIILSALLIHWYGLAGVALGTLIPVAFSAIFVLYPSACRQIGLPLRRAVTEAIFPALWPAVVVGGLLAVTRSISSGTLLAVVAQAAAAFVLYLALFFAVAISRDDRDLYLGKLLQLLRRVRPSGPRPRSRLAA
jgi:O-antigen/teichoic acid export membrane protein